MKGEQLELFSVNKKNSESEKIQHQRMPNNCKDCIYKDCLMRTDEDFTICPVEVEKQKYEKSNSINNK